MVVIKYVYYMKYEKKMEEDIIDLLGDYIYFLEFDLVEIKVVVDGWYKKKRFLKDIVILFLNDLMRINDKLGVVENIIIKYEDFKMYELKEKYIFEDKLIFIKKVICVKEELLRVDIEYMYNKIIEVYNDLYDKIEKFLKG